MEDDNKETSVEQHLQNACAEINQATVNARRARNNYYSVLMRLSGVYKAEGSPGDDFDTWVRAEFGFDMVRDGWDMYTAEYRIVDANKFLLFRLKYGI